MTFTLKNKSPLLPVIFLGLLAAIGVGCGGGGGGTPPPAAPTTFTVGGSISGLSNTGFVLQNNGGDDLNISAANVTFTFATVLNTNDAYDVSIATQPFGQTCTVSNGSGTVASANVSSVVINCTLTDSDASGLYTGGVGDATVGFVNVNSGTNYDLDFIRGIIYDNRFMFFNVDPKANTAANQNENILIDGKIISISGTTIDATASIYQAGRIVANNITVTGTVTSRNNISLTLSSATAETGAPAGNFNGGILNATFSTEFDRGASMTRLNTPSDFADIFNKPPVYMAIPSMRASRFVFESLVLNEVYIFVYDNGSSVSLRTQECRGIGSTINEPPADTPLAIPNPVLNVYLLADDAVPITDCLSITPRFGFTGFGALNGADGATWWYATANGLFSVYVESSTVP